MDVPLFALKMLCGNSINVSYLPLGCLKRVLNWNFNWVPYFLAKEINKWLNLGAPAKEIDQHMSS